jgi:hypothetical protein
MMITLDDAIALKQEIKNRFATDVHFHDGCGGQYFTLDEKNEAVVTYITDYYAKLSQKAVFSADGLQFTVEK